MFKSPTVSRENLMRPRTPTLIWIPFIFSIGTISWALLVGSLLVLAVLVITPAVQQARAAEADRNNVQASLDLLDQKIALQNEFIQKAGTDSELMMRLASRRLGVEKKGQETLILSPDDLHRDPSVASLLAQSLKPITPKPVAPLPWFLEPATHKPTRTTLLMIACGGLVLSFVLGVRYDRRQVLP